MNEITSQSGGTKRTLSYDLNGKLVNDGSARTFEWDGANRLVAVNYTGTTNRSEFIYDGLSRCVKVVEKTNGSITSTRKFVWCGTEKCEFRGANNGIQLQVFSQGQYQSNTAYFYTRDHLGSIREMTDGAGTVVARYDYDPYGRSTIVIGANKPDFNFTGLYQHSKSGLDLAVYRAYDSELGRWLSRDPIEEAGGANLLAYVGNNPGSLADPLGWAALITVEGDAGTGVTIFDPRPQESGGPYVYPSSNSVVPISKDGANGPYTSDDIYILPGPYKQNPSSFGPNPIILTNDPRGRWVHGGGGPSPLIPYQGWWPTHGCTRMQNDNLLDLVNDILDWKYEYPNQKIPYQRYWPDQQLLDTTHPGVLIGSTQSISERVTEWLSNAASAGLCFTEAAKASKGTRRSLSVPKIFSRGRFETVFPTEIEVVKALGKGAVRHPYPDETNHIYFLANQNASLQCHVEQDGSGGSVTELLLSAILLDDRRIAPRVRFGPLRLRGLSLGASKADLYRKCGQPLKSDTVKLAGKSVQRLDYTSEPFELGTLNSFYCLRDRIIAFAVASPE